MATLVVRPDKVGDLVLATPVAEAIKTVSPHEEVLFLCSSYAKDVLLNNPFVDEVIEVAPPEELIKRLRSFKIERAVVLFPTLGVSWAIFRAKVPERYTSGFRWYQFLYNHVIHLRRSKCLHKEWEYNLMLAREAFPEIDVHRFYPKVFPTTEALEKAHSLLKGKSRPVVLVYPGGGGERRWPAEHFVRLCQRIESFGTPVVPLGPAERELSGYFERWLLPPLSLEELTGVIALCDGVVSNNTGPMHIAATLKKPLVQLFDPRRACNPRRWGHDYPGSSVLVPPVPECESCSPSCKYQDCMRLIPVEWVEKELRRCLSL